MMSKLSFFVLTLQYDIFRFSPHKRQEFAECLEELSEVHLEDPWCGDILTIWMNEFGCSGLVLGNISMFLLGFLVLLAADLIVRRIHNMDTAILLNILSAAYCIGKFKVNSRRSTQNILILLYIAFSLAAGFQWSITMLFLILFVNMAAIAGRGGRLC